LESDCPIFYRIGLGTRCKRQFYTDLQLKATTTLHDKQPMCLLLHILHWNLRPPPPSIGVDFFGHNAHTRQYHKVALTLRQRNADAPQAELLQAGAAVLVMIIASDLRNFGKTKLLSAGDKNAKKRDLDAPCLYDLIIHHRPR